MLALILLLINLGVNISLLEQDGGLTWKTTHKMKWSDFQGNVPSGYDEDIKANTSSTVSYSFASEGSILNFSTLTTFNHENSWVRSGSESSDLLKHEQGHFDLAEYQRRLFCEYLHKAKFKSIQTIVKEIEEIASKAAEVVDKIHDIYDKETDHSRNYSVQLDWDTKIVEYVKSKNAYLNQNISIDIGYLLKP